ncbi:MAG: hypothetical protein J3R72DRAFT_500189 [Linnemannia gamsii]|nr:MAG: hypothetical protein J3R72DRAFT_500189 [Linnemannia gamsii]
MARRSIRVLTNNSQVILSGVNRSRTVNNTRQKEYTTPSIVMNQQDPTAFSDLPEEVKVLIGHALTQHQLTVCVRVCKAWKALFSPILWRHVEDSASRKTRRWFPGRDHTLLACIAQHGVLKLKCRYIHSLRLECSEVDFTDLQARHQLPSTLPRLRSVEFIGSSAWDKDIARFIRRGSPAGWKQIIFRTNHHQGWCRFGKESVKEVLKHAATLEVLRVEAAWCLSSLEIQELLCGLPKLKEFLVLGAVQLYVPPDPSLKASDLVASQWVCTDLEIFGCTIEGVPPPDTKQQQGGGGGGGGNHNAKTKAHRESIHLQRQVRYNDHQSYNCLTMSLEGGLDLLHGLKELRKVGLEDMDVEIGNPAEQEWVKANWPHATIQYPGNPETGPRLGIFGDNDDNDNEYNALMRERLIAAIEDDFYGADEYDPDWQPYADSGPFSTPYDPDYGGS